MNYKKDFPIFQKNPSLVYLDSAATSQKPKLVLDAVDDYYANYNANVRRSLYPIAEKATQKVEEVRKKVARFINAKSPEEIIFVRNTTEAINLVMYGWGKNSVQTGDAVMSTIMEHHSNFVPWQQLALEKNATFKVLDITDEGLLKMQDSRFKIQDSRILALTHVSNVLGTINPIKDIITNLKSSIVNHKSPLVLVDGAQAVPHLKVDVQALDCDFYAFSGHKMMASTGIGVLYGKKELLENMQPFLFGGEMIKEVSIEKTTFADLPFTFEAGTPDIAGIVSLGTAIDYLESIDMEQVREHEKKLIAYCLSRMEGIEGLTVYGPKDIQDRSGVISFTLEGIHAHDTAQILGDMGICIRAGHHCAMPLHKRLGVPATARASFYVYNDEQEVDKLIEGIKQVKKIFKK